MKTPEGYVKDDIDKYLKRLPRCKVYKPVPVGMGGENAVDRLCCINGRFVAIEVKREGKKPTVLQERYLKEVIEAGGIAFWCDSFESFMLNMAANGLVPR